jgi:hypothetical protein
MRLPFAIRNWKSSSKGSKLTNMKKYFLIAFFLGLFLTISAKAQNSDLTWQELKKQQSEERVSLENMQKETLNKMIEIQKIQLETLKSESSSTSNDLLILIDKQTQERKDIAKFHSEERTKLAQTHAEERKEYLLNSSKKP